MRTPQLSAARSNNRRRTATVAIAVLALGILVGCGGSDDGDSTESTSPVETVATTTSVVSTTTPPTTSTTLAPTTTTTAPPTTSAPTTVPAEPALDVAGAEARIGEEGDWAPDMSTYDPGATLSAVLAVVSGGASAASPEQVFFFNQGRYLGTATSTPRVATSITAVNDNEITVRYGNYASTDPFCCPSLDPYIVTFTWDGSAVVPNGEFPPEGQGLN